MELSYTIDIKQEQKQNLTMTPKLQLAINLLQFSTLELVEYIKEEIIDNPLLELESNYESLINNYVRYDGEEINYENFIAKELTLEEYLLQQLNLVNRNKKEKEIAKQIIGNLGQYGFFTDIENVEEELDVSRKKVLKVLEEIKGLKPSGIAACGVKESLLIQLNNLNNFNTKEIELSKKIIEDHWEELDKNQVKKIAKRLKIKPTQAQHLIDLIKSLNPNPIKEFNSKEGNEYLKADIFIKKNKNEYVIIMEEASFPTLKINNYYRKLLKKEDSKENKKYLKEKLDSALWLIKSIEQRRQTIYKIVKAIIFLQQDFLKKGVEFLEPMTMKEVANEIEMHQSTVSRAVNGKYIQTPQGLFPLKFLFSEGLEGESKKVSTIKIKKWLERLIDNEDKSNPLSDRQLAEKMKDKGVAISRRTIAAYRKELKISSSRQRKRYY
ncbi:MAG: RNA polymerase factor sigma-54 [Bacillota bacterium]